MKVAPTRRGAPLIGSTIRGFSSFGPSCTDVRADAAVCGGHRGSDQADVSHASDQSSETYFPGGLQILWGCAQVQAQFVLKPHQSVLRFPLQEGMFLQTPV